MTKSPAKPLDIQALYRKAKGNATVIIDRAAELEAKGWETWLMTLFPFWFSEEFSPEHRQYWSQFWDVLLRIRRGESIPNNELVIMLLLGRGLGKSSCVEAGRIMRLALLGGGYCLMISETDDQAQEHLGNCRILIEHPDSKLTEYYPEMAITDHSDVIKGLPTADRKEMFILKNGGILRAKGLSAKMRGLRVGVHRPNDVTLDDIDDVNDSLALSINKLRQITASILPVQARENVTISVAQNLISEHSVVNQIFTGKSDALADRTVIGPTAAFSTLEIDTRIDEVTGKLKHVIQPTSVPSWKGLSIDRAQKFLDNSGLQTFLAEYQNEFDQFKSGRVIPEYNEDVQIITWSEFERVYGERRIPAYWQCDVGLDIGYSEGMYPHYSGWVFATTSAMNSPLPRKVFIYRTMSFQGVSIDDQADAVKEALLPDERIRFWRMSHEKTGEWMTLNAKHKLPFSKFTHYKSEDGVAQWRHLSRVDKTQPHPFKEDRLLEDGTYELGDCMLFYIVDDEQVVRAVDDRGHRLLREQVATWEYVPVKVTDTGQTVQRPSKINDDLLDAARCGIFAYFNPEATDFTPDEKMFQTLPEAVRVKPEELTEQGRVTQIMHLKKALEKREQRQYEAESEWVGSR